MKKYLSIIPFFLILFVWAKGFSQPIGSEGKAWKIEHSLHMEKVYVHTDKPTYITGETLWFSVYCMESQTHKPSQYSKIVNLDIIGPSGDAVKQVRIKLNDGFGKGQLFITPDIVSGIHRIRAYTSWMKNFPDSSIFYQDIRIINPSIPPDSEASPTSSLQVPEEKGLHENITKTVIEIKTDQDTYSSREKATVNLTLPHPETSLLSISVYHKIFHEENKVESIVEYLSNAQNSERSTLEKYKINYPPEISTSILSGSIPDLNGKLNLLVGFSGIQGTLNSVVVRNNSNFYLEFPFGIESNKVYLRGTDSSDINSLRIHSPFLPADSFKVTKTNYLHKKNHQSLEDLIGNVMVNQAYKESSKTNGLPSKNKRLGVPFYGFAEVSYKLDDYTLFNTLNESFVEYIREAGIKKKNNNISIHIRNESGLLNPTPALLLLDGIPFDDLATILKINPKKMHKIDIIQSPFLLGSVVYQGIVNFITDQEDFAQMELPTKIVERTYHPIQQPKEFFHPDHSSITGKEPDFRNVLYWNPDQRTSGANSEFSFYTGDHNGEYLIEINGLDLDGNPLYGKFTLRVESSAH